MKKIYFSLLLLISLFSLTSCKINWFGASYTVHWLVIFIPVLVILLGSHVWIITRKYKCPKCNHFFKPRWYEISAWLHYGNKRLVKCKKCGYKGFCPTIDKGENI